MVSGTGSKRRIINSDRTFATPFSRAYWELAVGELSSVKRLVIAAMFVAIRLVLSGAFIRIPLATGQQRIFLNFTVTSLGGIIYGPVFALIVGTSSDLLGAYLFPNGPFFIGYTITQMMGDFLYALFFYRARLSITRILFAKISVSAVCNILLNSLWANILSTSGGSINTLIATIIARTPKNIILLPFEVTILVIFLGVMCRAVQNDGIISYKCFDGKIKIF